MTIINVETGEIIEPMSEDAARRLTERIRIAATNYTEAKAKVLQLVDEAKAGSAHVALGYKSWTAYLSDVLSDEPLRLARDERRELVTRLADEGMSTRAIAPIVGANHSTVVRDLESTGANAPVAVVRETEGLDGRVRTVVTAGRLRKPSRRSLTDAFFDANYDLARSIDRIARLAEDDRFPQNAEQIATKYRSDLIRARDLLAQVVNSLPKENDTK